MLQLFDLLEQVQPTLLLHLALKTFSLHDLLLSLMASIELGHSICGYGDKDACGVCVWCEGVVCVCGVCVWCGVCGVVCVVCVCGVVCVVWCVCVVCVVGWVDGVGWCGGEVCVLCKIAVCFHWV